MTNRELSQAIRKKLKECGYGSKDYSIRVSDAGYSTSVRIKIINPLVRRTSIEEVVKEFEVVDRDERTGEVLQGGNTYVLCSYENGIFEEAEESLLGTAEQVFNSSRWDGKKIAENADSCIRLVYVNPGEKCLRMYDKEGNRSSVDSQWLHSARELARAMWRYKNIGTIFA